MATHVDATHVFQPSDEPSSIDQFEDEMRLRSANTDSCCSTSSIVSKRGFHSVSNLSPVGILARRKHTDAASRPCRWKKDRENLLSLILEYSFVYKLLDIVGACVCSPPNFLPWRDQSLQHLLSVACYPNKALQATAKREIIHE